MSKHIFIRHKGQNIKIALEEILYIEANKNYTMLKLQDFSYMLLYSLLEWERVLPEELFCRVHRSFIVALGKIQAFDRSIITLQEREIPIGEEYCDRLFHSVCIVAERRSTVYARVED